MGAHIFLVGEDNFELCKNHGVYGCVMPTKEWNKAEIIAGIYSIQTGDLVFFYVKNKGIYGLWKIKNSPFFDNTRIWSNEKQSYPFRFLFEPVMGSFVKPISLTDVLDLHDKGKIWTFDLNPVQQKNQYKITMGEARELLRLLLRNNPIKHLLTEVENPYIPNIPEKIDLNFDPDHDGHFRYEGWLNAWFMKTIANGGLHEILGDYDEFLNLVPTTFNKVLDIFLTHVTNVGAIEVIHKYTCIELKVDKASEQDLTQILRYEDWLARKLASGDRDMMQSILVAFRFSEQVIEYVKNRHRIEEKVIRLISYKLNSEKQSVDLYELPI